MGVNLKEIVDPVKKEIEFKQLFGKVIAIDAFNALYQFLFSIRQDGEPLRDSKGRITSHLSGLFYRTINLLEYGIKPIYVFDGTPPKFKIVAWEKRKKHKEQLESKYKEALKKGNIQEAIKYAKSLGKLDSYMVEEAKKLLEAMGIPYVQAPSEGEAEAAYLTKKGVSDYCGSQDYDSLLFGSPRVVRNITISEKRKLPGKNIYVEVKPEVIELEAVLNYWKITREQLIAIAMLLGTDYNEKVPGIGPKTAIEIVKRFGDPIKVIEYYKIPNVKEIFEFFLNPPVIDFEPKWGKPNKELIFKILVEEHDFNPERVERAIERLEKALNKINQKTLFSFFGS